MGMITKGTVPSPKGCQWGGRRVGFPPATPEMPPGYFHRKQEENRTKRNLEVQFPACRLCTHLFRWWCHTHLYNDYCSCYVFLLHSVTISEEICKWDNWSESGKICTRLSNVKTKLEKRRLSPFHCQMWPRQISTKFHFLKFWETKSTICKYRKGTFIWMVTS